MFKFTLSAAVSRLIHTQAVNDRVEIGGTLYTFIGEVFGWNFGRNTGCPDSFSAFLPFPQGNTKIALMFSHDTSLLNP
jgi:hypothetical protein